MENKNVGLFLLGIVGVVAVIGIVLMFCFSGVAGLSAYGTPKVYSGGAKEFYANLDGSAGYYAPYEHSGPTKMIYEPDEHGNLIGQAIRTEHFGYNRRDVSQIPTFLQTAGMLGPIPLREASELYLRGEHIVYNPSEGGYFYKPSEKSGDIDKEI